MWKVVSDEQVLSLTCVTNIDAGCWGLEFLWKFFGLDFYVWRCFWIRNLIFLILVTESRCWWQFRYGQRYGSKKVTIFSSSFLSSYMTRNMTLYYMVYIWTISYGPYVSLYIRSISYESYDMICIMIIVKLKS